MTNSVIDAVNLRVRRDGVEVLHGLSFALSAGCVTGVVGPSGCGKTTLIRAIAGVQRMSGSLRVLGDRAGAPTLRRAVSYAAQSAATYPDLSAVENLRYFASVLGTQRADVDRVLRVVGLWPVRDRLVGRLSGGQRSRVSLAIALLGAPRLLLLDEPTVGLDPVLRAQLWQMFGELAGDGMSLLVSTHVMDEAEHCHELLLIREGALLALDSPRSLRERTGAADLDRAFVTLIEHAQLSA